MKPKVEALDKRTRVSEIRMIVEYLGIIRPLKANQNDETFETQRASMQLSYSLIHPNFDSEVYHKAEVQAQVQALEHQQAASEQFVQMLHAALNFFDNVEWDKVQQVDRYALKNVS